jgi:hypothetical protein
MESDSHLPGQELVEQGLLVLQQNLVTDFSLLVLIAARTRRINLVLRRAETAEKLLPTPLV